jgi:cobalt-zinc-cadmium efflux system membrane fusion protein
MGLAASVNERLASSPALPRARQYRLVAIVAAVLVTLLLVGKLIGALTHHSAPPEAAPPPGTFQPTSTQLAQMKIESVTDGSAPGTIEATGIISVNGDRSTPVLLPYSGQVTDVLVQAGQHVVKWQPLLRVASADFVDARNALITASTQQATAAAQLRIAQNTVKRAQAIYQTAGGALKDYLQSQTDLVAAQSASRSADAAVEAARARLALLGKSGSEVQQMRQAGPATSAVTTYNAPVGGVIATRDVAPGQYVGQGSNTPLMTIADLSTVWLVAQLPESDTASVRLGDEVIVTTPAYPGRQFRAVVNNIAAELDPNTHRLPVRATVSNPDGALKPQMFASFTIQRRGTGVNGLLVPANAVIHEGDSARVWVIGPNNILRARPVQVGDSVGSMDKITAGLSPGERIVTSGALFVNEAGLGG